MAEDSELHGYLYDAMRERGLLKDEARAAASDYIHYSASIDHLPITAYPDEQLKAAVNDAYTHREFHTEARLSEGLKRDMALNPELKESVMRHPSMRLSRPAQQGAPAVKPVRNLRRV